MNFERAKITISWKGKPLEKNSLKRPLFVDAVSGQPRPVDLGSASDGLVFHLYSTREGHIVLEQEG